MLSILPRRGKGAYESFVAALIKTGNEDSSDFLRAKEDPRSSQSSVQPKPSPFPATEDKGKQCWPAINLK
jgi:hypothetical protein